MRLQFPLYKLFLVLAVYAAALGAMSQLGWSGIAIALITAAAGSTLVLFVRSRRDLVAVGIAGSGGLIGAFLSYAVLCPPVLNRYDTMDAIREGVILGIGALAGALLFSWASKR